MHCLIYLIVITPTLQMSQVRLRGLKWLSCGHTASKWKGCDCRQKPDSGAWVLQAASFVRTYWPPGCGLCSEDEAGWCVHSPACFTALANLFFILSFSYLNECPFIKTWKGRFESRILKLLRVLHQNLTAWRKPAPVPAPALPTFPLRLWPAP